ncbi:MAG TPA: UDP-3-O-(3-hydroxymyristoyl)glucosamine N-acyltransferase [Planctomycetota bacterium]|nr:UDP-3-O-(3-hydroxymyristoyl)glucosamine N-acyltransferase [Planctomycetota bacterium]
MDMTLGELAESLGGRLSDETTGGRRVTGIRSLVRAAAEHVSFYKGDKRYLDQVKATQAGAIICDAPPEGATRPLIIVDDAAMTVSFLLAAERDLQDPPAPPGIHGDAFVDPEAKLGDGVSVGPFAVIEAGAKIGARSRIMAHAFVGRNAVLGEECVLHPGACVLHSCQLGARVILWPYAVVGRDGFGFLQRDGNHLRIPQVGGVSIGDDVEIGCWSSVDRGAVDPTVVEQGVKIDSHCHVAHNCFVGEHALLIGYARMGGSAHIGKRAIMAQDARVGEHRTVGDGAILATSAGVMYKDVPPGETYHGTPAVPVRHATRIDACLNKLPDLVAEVRDLKKRLAKLEGERGGSG